MAMDEKGGRAIRNGIDDVLAALPSSIPPEIFEEDESVVALPPIPAMPRVPRLPRPTPPPMRTKTPPPLPARAKAASAHVPIDAPTSMSAMVVPAAFESSRMIAAIPPEDAESEIDLPGVSRSSWAKKLLVFAVAAAVAFVAARKIDTKRSAAVSAPVVAATVAPVPPQMQLEPPHETTAAPATQPTAEIAEPEPGATTAPPSDHGSIDTAKAMPGRRVFVDGHVVGQTPGSMLVKCGAHKVKVGSAGHVRKIDVPCGDTIEVGDF